jgi:hypothetical protein
MLRKRNRSKNLWKATSANRRKRKIHLNKQRAFNRQRAALIFFDKHPSQNNMINLAP